MKRFVFLFVIVLVFVSRTPAQAGEDICCHSPTSALLLSLVINELAPLTPDEYEGSFIAAFYFNNITQPGNCDYAGNHWLIAHLTDWPRLYDQSFIVERDYCTGVIDVSLIHLPLVR